MKILFIFYFVVFLFSNIFDLKLKADSLPISSSGLKKEGDGGWLFVPPSIQKQQKTNLLVALHGCRQTALDFANGSRLNELATRYQFIIFYPQQRQPVNHLNCWQWYESNQQKRGKGEAQEIINDIEQIKKSYQVNRLFVAGISSGGAMVSILLSCYPEVFVGGAIHSGVPYGLANNAQEGLELMRSGPSSSSTQRNHFCDPDKFLGQVMILHGQLDQTVNPKNADRIQEDFFPHPNRPEKIEEKFFEKKQNQYGYRLRDFYRHGKIHSRLVLIEDLGHAWSGGDESLPFNDSRGPSAGLLMWEFFSSQSNQSKEIRDTKKSF